MLIYTSNKIRVDSNKHYLLLYYISTASYQQVNIRNKQLKKLTDLVAKFNLLELLACLLKLRASYRQVKLRPNKEDTSYIWVQC